MKKSFLAILSLVTLAFAPPTVLAFDTEEALVTVRSIRVTSPELSGIQAYRFSTVTFDQSNPTSLTCFPIYAYDEENSALALLLTRNKDRSFYDPAEVIRVVIEDNTPGVQQTCWVRLVNEPED